MASEQIIKLKDKHYLFKELSGVFEYIAHGGTEEDRTKGIYPVKADNGQIIGVRLGGPEPREGKQAISVLVGTHPNEVAG